MDVVFCVCVVNKKILAHKKFITVFSQQRNGAVSKIVKKIQK